MNKKNNLPFGFLGEKIAACYLTSLGYKILERNFRPRYGDIDIVAKEGEVLVFVEVKSRKSTSFGLGEEALTPRKISSLKRAIDFYLYQKKLKPQALRIDLVSLYFQGEKLQEIKLYKNITG